MTDHYTTRSYPTRELWLQGRRTRLGASDVAAVVGASQFASAYSVWLSKVDPPPSDPMTEYQEWGLRLEPAIAEKFQEETGFAVRDPGEFTIFDSTHWDWLSATIDRAVIAEVNEEPCELKTVNAFDASVWRKAETVPQAYIVQAHVQMLVMGTRRAWFAVLAGGNAYAHYPIEMDRELAKLIIRRTQKFWTEHVVPMVAPDVDFSKATADALAAQYSNPKPGVVYLPESFENHGMRYDRACRVAAKADKRKRLLQNQVKEAMGDDGTLAVLPDGIGGFAWKPNCNGVRTFLRKEKVRIDDDSNGAA